MFSDDNNHNPFCMIPLKILYMYCRLKCANEENIDFMIVVLD